MVKKKVIQNYILNVFSEKIINQYRIHYANFYPYKSSVVWESHQTGTEISDFLYLSQHFENGQQNKHAIIENIFKVTASRTLGFDPPSYADNSNNAIRSKRKENRLIHILTRISKLNLIDFLPVFLSIETVNVTDCLLFPAM